MEPLDPAKNDEGSGFSKRRISSILKAPRRSVHFPEPKQPEKVVESVKPVDKRNSRRVSFAPANDVLLFSKDVKSTSPVRSPLQELITTVTTTQNGVQVELTEDGVQSMGIETLLNAPLHASQQRIKADFDSGHVFGEKTVMFSTDDAFMDMTQSHTINIADDADTSIQNSFTTRGENRVLTANNGAMDITLSHNGNIGSVPTSGNVDLRVEKRNLSSSALTLDPGFENFLASLSKPKDASVNPVITTMTSAASTERTKRSMGQFKPHRVDVCKENQPPTSVSEVMEKSLSTSRKICELSYEKAVCPEEDLSMDMTEAQTGRIVGFSDDDDPFQCLFPTQEMYSRLDSRMSQTKDKTKLQQISKPQSSLNPTDLTSLKNPSLQDQIKRHKDNLDTTDECREKTIIFTADDDIVDMTQSRTLKINIDSFAPSNQNVDITRGKINYASSLEERKHETCGTPGLSAKGLDLEFKNILSSLSTTVAPSGRPVIATMVPSTAASSLETVDTSGSLSQLKSTVWKENNSLIATRVSGESFNGGTICPENDASMNLTGGILGLTGSDDPFQFLFPTKDMYSKGSLKKQEITPRQQHNEVLASSNRKGMSTSLTASLKTKVQKHQVKMDAEDDCGEKTVRFTADDAAMDVTKSHTVNIEPYLQLQSHQNADILSAYGEKTVRFTADDAAMDVTKSHTVNIEPYLQQQFPQNVDILPAYGEKTVRFTADDAAMDVTQAVTVEFNHNSTSDLLPHQYSDISSNHENNFPLSVEKTHLHRRNRSLSAYALNPGFRNSLAKTSGPWANPVITRPAALTALSPQKTEDAYGFLHQVKTQKPDVETEKEAPAFVSAAVKKPINKTMMEDPEPDVSMNEAQTCISEQTDDQCPPSTLDSKKAEVTSQLSSEALGSSNPDCKEITNLPDSLHSNETITGCKPRNPTLTLSEEMENSPSAVNHDVDAAPSRKSRRISLVDLQSKVRRLSHIINKAPVTIAMEACTAPLPRLDLDKNSNDETKCPPVTEPELVMGLVNTEENAQDKSNMDGERSFTTSIPTPFTLKTKQLMSRLSVGSFKAKLPQKDKEPKKQTSVGEPTSTTIVNVTNKLSNFDNDFSNIFDEELASCEEMSETLDMSPQKAAEEVSASHVFEDDVFEEDFVSSVHAKKRPLPADENDMDDEKRMKTSPETPADVETSHFAESLQTTQTSDYSNSNHTASTRGEATLESTFKQSLFESQLEDYTNDLQRKLNDDNITVSEFFKLFNIDFVIHNPRQSVLPDRHLSDTNRTQMDLLKDRYIYHPKQMVYEKDILNLTKHVEGLKGRLQDLDKPLKIVNGPLWEEVRNYSEKELKSFGAKLKERNNLFRKLSKVQSHEMKEVLYSNIVQAGLEEQQRLRGTIGEADEMLKSLDDCIHELETELTAVEEKGFEDKPSLKSLQEEMQKVTEVLADNDRRISELEMQKKHNSNKLNRLKAETRNLESHIDVLHSLNEWKFAEKTDNSATYSFLYESLHLELVYEESSGNNAGNQSERKISHLAFKFQLDDEKSWGHACLVHRLLSEYTEGEGDWVEKYPTSRHVPALLHDVSLVVSRCRLLGEELRLLKMWGALRLDILNISCVDTRVHIVFSSLETCSKFEVIFSVGLIDRFYVLQVHSFKNMIGNITIQQIEEIVASFSPAKNLLTKIVKSIHDNLLC